MVHRIKTVCLTALLPVVLHFIACGNDQPADHDAALPENLDQAGNLTEAESAELAAAKGKSATLVSPQDLLAKVKADTAAVLVVNFWKTDCLACINLQQHLQNLQNKNGEEKIHLLAVNLDDEANTATVNLVLRKAGIAADVLQVKKGTDNNWRNSFSGGWQGNVPAVFIQSKDGLKQFHSRELSEEELGAMLQPLLL
ncbi:MAG: hypothetical protein HY842_13660 [Bacteroidetes bacterium]|nr:hypothetical protein [Bacteroidota bacterium]